MLRFPLLQNFCLPPFITGRFVTAASLFVLFPPSSLKPLCVLSVLFLALPTAALLSSHGDHRLRPGRALSHDAYMRVMLRWDPLDSGNAPGLFPTLVLRCREPGITTESS